MLLPRAKPRPERAQAPRVPLGQRLDAQARHRKPALDIALKRRGGGAAARLAVRVQRHPHLSRKRRCHEPRNLALAQVDIGGECYGGSLRW